MPDSIDKLGRFLGLLNQLKDASYREAMTQSLQSQTGFEDALLPQRQEQMQLANEAMRFANQQAPIEAQRAGIDRYLNQLQDLMGVSQQTPGFLNKVRMFPQAMQPETLPTMPQWDPEIARRLTLLLPQGKQNELTVEELQFLQMHPEFQGLATE